ncbi:MAG: hypothetical protein IT371_12030 [Deltaproteobacteria bacterium]|nr:hypothetical protein [Deltaproteobacteria bacterium]
MHRSLHRSALLVGASIVTLLALVGCNSSSSTTLDAAVGTPDVAVGATDSGSRDGAVTHDGKAPADQGTSDATGSKDSVAPADAAPPLDLTIEGCTQVSGDRPASNGSTAAPQVANAKLAAATPGQPLSGSFDFTDPQSDTVDVIIQVNGATVHYVCTLSGAENAAKKFDLSRLKLGAKFTPGTYLIYIGVRDAAGNVSGYLVVSLVVGTGGSIKVCATGTGSAAPFQLAGKAPSYSTSFYEQKNGSHPEYRNGTSASGTPLTIVYQSEANLDLGSCTKLLLSGDAAGTKPVGWDNCMLAQVRDAPGGAIVAHWYYCSGGISGIYHVPTSTPLAQHLAPTIPGTSLDPAVPNGAAFGYPAKAIDLMAKVPAGKTRFVLTLYVLDFGSVGSTTEIWAQPQ